MNETTIVLDGISHKKYNLIVEHLSKYPTVSFSDSNSASKEYPIIITKVGRAIGNPPAYSEVEIAVRTQITSEEAKRILPEAFKGLVDIILSDD